MRISPMKDLNSSFGDKRSGTPSSKRCTTWLDGLTSGAPTRFPFVSHRARRPRRASFPTVCAKCNPALPSKRTPLTNAMTITPGQGSLRSFRHADLTGQWKSAFTVLKGGRNRKRRLWVAILIIASVVLLTAILLTATSSYRRNVVIQDLEEATGTRLQVKHFRQSYFPHPGCEIEGLTFVLKEPSNAHLITIQKLIVVGSYVRLFAHHVSLMRADGMQVVVPPLGTAKFFERSKSKTVVEQFVTENAVLDFSRRDPGQSRLRFLIH